MKFVYPGGLKKALTFSYDDGQIYDRRLTEIFRANGLKATFHLNSERLDPDRGNDTFVGVKELKEIYAGHEIACHGLQHRNPAQLSDQQLLLEIYEDRKNLERMTGEMIQGMSYAYGIFNEKIMDTAKTVGIKYSRTVNSTGGFHTPTDFLQWNPTCHHADPRLNELADTFLNIPDYIELPLMYVWGHSFEFDRSNNWELIEQFAEKMAGKDDIWYATNMQIYNYLTATRSVEISADGYSMYNPTIVTLWMSTAKGLITLEPGETKYIGEH